MDDPGKAGGGQIIGATALGAESLEFVLNSIGSH